MIWDDHDVVVVMCLYCWRRGAQAVIALVLGSTFIGQYFWHKNVHGYQVKPKLRWLKSIVESNWKEMRSRMKLTPPENTIQEPPNFSLFLLACDHSSSLLRGYGGWWCYNLLLLLAPLGCWSCLPYFFSVCENSISFLWILGNWVLNEFSRSAF